MAETSWSVEFHPACEAWANDLNQSDAEALSAAIRVLRERGPSLGRPLVDTVKASRHPNMKELRPGSTGRTKIRVLFAFDTQRQAILLIGGDKSDNWTGWYKTNIPIADDRLEQHEAALAESRSAAKTAEQPATPTRKGRQR
jgi:hypothetical protein